MTAVVALTGGIASGKTVVSDRLSELKVPVIDTDIIAREVVAPGQPLLEAITRQFGGEIVLPNGSLDRKRLRQRVFANEDEREALEALMHPEILKEVQRRIQQIEAPYCVVVIPLLAENGRRPWIDRVLVVDTPEAVQLERLMRRDNTSEPQARAILRAQASREERLAIADDVIVNDDTLDALLAATELQHQRYLEEFEVKEG